MAMESAPPNRERRECVIFREDDCRCAGVTPEGFMVVFTKLLVSIPGKAWRKMVNSVIESDSYHATMVGVTIRCNHNTLRFMECLDRWLVEAEECE